MVPILLLALYANCLNIINLSLFEYIIPISLLVKIVLIIVLALVTVLGAVIIPRGKLFVIIGGIIAILLVWYIDLGA